MSEPREAFIEKLMAHITRLTMIPKVQVERAVAPILGLFIAELLSARWSKQVVMICEEFPLRKAQAKEAKGIRTYQSTNIDWLLYDATDDQLVFLELKTADTSFDPAQEEIYRRLIMEIGECGSSFLVKDIEEIMFASLERKKYEEVLKCVQDPCYSNCRKAKLVYLAPAAMREARGQHPGNGVEWLSFQDLPEEAPGEFAVEWRIIRRQLVQLDRMTRHSRNGTQEGGERRNYGDTCGFEEMVRLCEENGNTIVVGFDGGPRKLRATTLDEICKRPAFKWDHTEGGKGVKDDRNWIPGRKFLEIVEGLMDD